MSLTHSWLVSGRFAETSRCHDVCRLDTIWECLSADSSPVAKQLLAQQRTPSATGRLVSALAIAAWARSATAGDQPVSVPLSLTARIHELLTAATPSQPTPGSRS